VLPIKRDQGLGFVLILKFPEISILEWFPETFYCKLIVPVEQEAGGVGGLFLWTKFLKKRCKVAA